MSDVIVTVVESNTNVTVTEQDVAVAVTENTVEVSASTAGIQGIPGANTDPIYVTVRNATGATLAKGTIVYISGSNGNHVQVTPAIATSDATSARTLGWLAASIANNASGLCQVEGYLEGLNTQGLTLGSQLYLSGTTAGAFTATKPVAPIHLVYVGVATKISAGDGHVFVKVQNGYELGELHDVLIVSPTNAQVLAYDSATQLWKNATNTPDGVTSITATAPLTGGVITSTGSIGLDQTALSITKSQVSDFTSGTVTSASTAQQSGTAVYSVNSGTAVYATTSGTAVYSANSGTAVTISGSITKSQVSDFTSGTVAQADNATTSGTAVYATNSGTAVFATTSGTAAYATDAGTAVFATTSGTATFATNSGTAVFATNASTAVSVSGSAITQSQVVNLTTDLANRAVLNAANAFTVGGHSITAQSSAIVPLILKGASSQTGDLLQVQSSDGTNIIRLRANLTNQTSSVATINGPVDIQPTAGGAGYGLFVRPGAAGVPAVLVRGVASQTASLTEWQNSGGTVLGFIGAAGNVSFAGGNFTISSIGGTSTSASLNALTKVRAGSTSSSYTGTLEVTSTSAATIGAVIRGAASQTANLQEWQNSAGTIRARIDQDGQFFNTFGIMIGGATNYGSTLNVLTQGAANIGAIIRGSASQTANLQEWQNSAGTILARVANSGRMDVAQLGSTASAQSVMTPGSDNGSFLINTAVATNKGLIVRGFTSQTANLQEWQNSAGTVLTRITATGEIVAVNDAIRGKELFTFNYFARLQEASSGARLSLVKMTASATNPGAGIGSLYFRDGTNAGTLKLVVRAGAAGAETTILDNIPQ